MIHYKGPYNDRTACGRTRNMKSATTERVADVTCPKCKERLHKRAEELAKGGDFELPYGNDMVGTAVRHPKRENKGISTLRRIVDEELARAGRRLVEKPELSAGDPKMLANDSLDVAVDRYLTKAGDTMQTTGEMDVEQQEGEPKFSPTDFGSDVANLVERMHVLVDLKGTVARRAINYVSKTYGEDAAKSLRQVLVNNFDIDVDSEHDAEGQREETRPAAVGAGGSNAATGGGGGGG